MRYLDTLALAVFALPAALLCASESSSAERVEFFERKIRPVLVKQCYSCHSADAESVKGGLRLDTRVALRSGGESGPAVIPGDAAASLLLSALRYESFEMPPAGKLPQQVIRDFETWIEMGAPDPRADPLTPKQADTSIDWDAARQFWSFQSPQRYPLPRVKRPRLVNRPVDRFILARLDRAGLTPNSPADRRTLMRRITFDLTGLPPTRSAVEAFVRDRAPDAYQRVVERLLASPRYGERWARMWLDVARFAEDQAHIVGNNSSLFYPNAYLYRDWVIQAMNDDLPFDRFVRLQLAADLLQPDDDTHHAALGFIGLGPKYYRRNTPEVMADEWEDRVDTVSRGLLGLTVACARCHNHKFDPIPTEDYYALAGVFASTEMFNRPLDKNRETDNEGEAKKPIDGLHVVRDTTPVDLNVFVRGDVNLKGPLVKRHFPQILCPEQPRLLDDRSGRLQLAEAIVDNNNPLTARVLVNRVWAQVFGRALVGTTSNFGSLGERPTHPRLLDDLAVRFMTGGWSMKHLQRELTLSATYQQSSNNHPLKQSRDESNRLLWRMNRRRKSIEAWRDGLLFAAGRLDTQIGGKSIEPQNTNQRRRTVYSRVSRLELDSMLALFDFPDPNAHSARRSQTTTPLQKLFALNSPFMIQQADHLARRLLDKPQHDWQRIDWAYHLLYGRPATDQEVLLALDYLLAGRSSHSERWSQYAQVLLVSNEMLFVD